LYDDCWRTIRSDTITLKSWALNSRNMISEILVHHFRYLFPGDAMETEEKELHRNPARQQDSNHGEIIESPGATQAVMQSELFEVKLNVDCRD
jgi:hypothetical protein